jgi:hypothetical protein
MVSIAVDSWTPPGMKFSVLGIIAFYTDSNWKVRHICLDMHDVSEKSGKEAICTKIYTTLEQYQLQNRILSITGDNGSHISTDFITSMLESNNITVKHSIPWIRCFSHIINLVCQELFKIKNDTSTASSRAPKGLENLIEAPEFNMMQTIHLRMPMTR